MISLVDMATKKSQDPPVMSAADAIRAELVRRRMTQIDLARQLGVHPQQVGYWVNRERRIPAEHLPAVARWLGMSARELHARNSTRDPEEILNQLERQIEDLRGEVAELRELRGMLEALLKKGR